MRGKGRQNNHAISNVRIIPAHAGKSDGRPDKARRARDHPRSCGEKASHHRILRFPLGSSPLMRGKEAGRQEEEKAVRIIPAHAGKRTRSAERILCMGDHPRSCGEKGSNSSPGLSLPGSSPLMRGKDTLYFFCKSPDGIIPAHAGKRRRSERYTA